MVNMVKLQQAAGILTEQSLSRLNALLNDEPPKPDAPCGQRVGDAPRRAPTSPPLTQPRPPRPQQGLDELEEPGKAPPMRLDEAPGTLAHALAERRIRHQACDDGAERGAIGRFEGATRLDQPPRDFRTIRGIGSRDHRHAERGRLEQIMASHRHETSAHECGIRGRIEGRELAHPIDEQDLRFGTNRRDSAAPVENHAARASRLATLSKRSGWRGTSTRSGAAAAATPRRARHAPRAPGLLLPLMGTAGGPDGPRAEYEAAQLAPLFDHRLAELHVELQVADHARARRGRQPMAMNRSASASLWAATQALPHGRR